MENKITHIQHLMRNMLRLQKRYTHDVPNGFLSKIKRTPRVKVRHYFKVRQNIILYIFLFSTSFTSGSLERAVGAPCVFCTLTLNEGHCNMVHRLQTKEVVCNRKDFSCSLLVRQKSKKLFHTYFEALLCFFTNL